MKLLILDRDGTLNAPRDDFVTTPADWEPLPGALEAVARLNQAGWRLVIASNQSGLGRGLLDMASLTAIHIRLNQLLAEKGGRLDAAFFCPHTPEEGCDCRKPLPGMLTQIGERFGVDLKGMPAVGDSARDLIAGAAVGCVPHLVLTGKAAAYKGRELPDSFPAGTVVHDDLAAFADHLVAQA